MMDCGDFLATGTKVIVRAGPPETHCRTPCYLRGKQGEIMEFLGEYRNPSLLAFHKSGLPSLRLYRVRFSRHGIWPDSDKDGPSSVVADLYEHWLTPIRGDSDG